MLNIVVRDGVNGRQFDMRLNDQFTRADFIREVQRALNLQNLNGQIFSVGGKHLNLSNDQEFNKEKNNVKDGSVIFKIQRIPGGTNVSVSTLLDIILLELPTELNRLPQIQEDCPICMESSSYIQICDDKMCAKCFAQSFKKQNMILKCTICGRKISLSTTFSNQFIGLLESYNDLVRLLQNVDCQMCRCGFLCYNDSLLPKSHCPNCRRNFCFFCNRDWNDNMNNSSKFTCKNQCAYDGPISFSLVDFEYAGKKNDGKYLQIPNQRTCPKCFNLGGYGLKCKYHTCDKCDPPYRFCFYCLNSVEDCLRENHPGLSEGSACTKKCMEPKMQDYSIYPRLLS